MLGAMHANKGLYVSIDAIDLKKLLGKQRVLSALRICPDSRLTRRPDPPPLHADLAVKIDTPEDRHEHQEEAGPGENHGGHETNGGKMVVIVVHIQHRDLMIKMYIFRHNLGNSSMAMEMSWQYFFINFLDFRQR